MNKTKKEIIDTAFTCFIEIGFRQTTLREIARRCDKKPSHIKYYFADTNEIFIEAFKLMAVDGISLIEQYSTSCYTDTEFLIAYLEAMLDWIGLNKSYQILWMMYSHQIIHDQKAKLIFQETLRVGQQRIRELIKPLLQETLSIQAVDLLAQNIQTLIIGTLYRVSTYENYSPQVRNNLTKVVFELIALTRI